MTLRFGEDLSVALQRRCPDWASVWWYPALQSRRVRQ